ncbi:hypothetical protein BJ508DRAFT_380885 [Ascobolus immersus RN42]|uniref:Uncharacterized protein n=1 Tax=Ascobolus immersus RN42 TaxID=1160509 RepID=A0A3N4HLR6_ASCIM|nr:hypothetical protein BJ508DRAFT_380885 [Ascobolus immersus RN42]
MKGAGLAKRKPEPEKPEPEKRETISATTTSKWRKGKDPIALVASKAMSIPALICNVSATPHTEPDRLPTPKSRSRVNPEATKAGHGSTCGRKPWRWVGFEKKKGASDYPTARSTLFSSSASQVACLKPTRSRSNSFSSQASTIVESEAACLSSAETDDAGQTSTEALRITTSTVSELEERVKEKYQSGFTSFSFDHGIPVPVEAGSKRVRMGLGLGLFGKPGKMLGWFGASTRLARNPNGQSDEDGLD